MHLHADENQTDQTLFCLKPEWGEKQTWEMLF